MVCLATWFVIERTRLGAYLRAATENPQLVQAFGINVPRMITLTYGFGVALAALAGVMAAPIYQVSPQMGADLIIVVFAVVVIGGMGSILGAIVTGFGLGLIEGLTKVFYPEASNTVIFVIMAIVLLIGRPACSARRSETAMSSVHQPHRARRRRPRPTSSARIASRSSRWRCCWRWRRPVVYPIFLMKVMCFALFACAFNLLIGFGGLLSFGHAMFLGTAGYASAHAAKVWGFTPELAILFGTGCAALLGWLAGMLAIRRQGIYFAMITLALAQMVFFFCLQAQVHRRRRRHPGGAARPPVRPDRPLAAAGDVRASCSLIFLGGFLLIYRIDPLAVRPGAEGDPRERGARHLARLRHRPLQAAGLRAVGHAGRAGRRDQVAGVPARIADRRALDACRARWC